MEFKNSLEPPCFVQGVFKLIALRCFFLGVKRMKNSRIQLFGSKFWYICNNRTLFFQKRWNIKPIYYAYFLIERNLKKTYLKIKPLTVFWSVIIWSQINFIICFCNSNNFCQISRFESRFKFQAVRQGRLNWRL